jgi:hypothetical protein
MSLTLDVNYRVVPARNEKAALFYHVMPEGGRGAKRKHSGDNDAKGVQSFLYA